MALLWFDGFNYGNTAGLELAMFYNSVSNPILTQNFVRTGASALRFIASSQFIQKTIAPGSNQIIVGFGLRNTGATASDRTIMRIQEGATVHAELVLLGSGSSYVLQLKNGDGTTIATGGTTITQSGTVWFYVELKILIHPSAGTYTLNVDDVQQFTGTGADTANGGTPVVNAIRLMTSVTVATEFDDFYILDDTGSVNNDFLTSDARVDTLNVDAAGDLAGWTPLSSTNASQVDDVGIHDGDTTYNSTSTVGSIDALNCVSLSVTPASIRAVQARVVARKDDAGVNQITTKVRSNGTAGTSSTHTLTTTYAGYVGALEIVDPDGGGDWTKPLVDAAQIQYERTA